MNAEMYGQQCYGA